MNERRGLALIIAAAALWGTTGTAQALGPETSDPLAVGLVRLLVAAPGLLAISWVSGDSPRRAGTRWQPILLAGLGMAAYQPAFFTAVKLTGVALGTVIAIGSAPLLAGLLGWAVEGDKPRRAWWLATAIGITGVALIAVAGDDSGASLRGVGLALAAGLAFAVYIVASRRVVGVANPVGGMSLVFGVAAVISLPMLAIADLAWLASTAGVVMSLHLGLVTTAAAYALFSVGLRTTPSGSAATASLAEPMTASLLGVLVLGEAPGAAGWLGMGLILAGLALLASRQTVSPDVVPAGKGWA